MSTATTEQVAALSPDSAVGDVAGAVSTTPNNSPREVATVSKVIDGDTISLSDGRIVRYIGIDTPETKHPSKPIGCWGLEAHQRNTELVLGKTVELEKDSSETDRYGRLLRYVYVGNVLVNEQLVAEGFAIAKAYPPDTLRQATFAQAQVSAQTAAAGIWAPTCRLQVTPTVGFTAGESLLETSVTATENSRECVFSCNLPDRDCGDFDSVTAAQVFFACCGFTRDNDPMRLDSVGVGDGLACE